MRHVSVFGFGSFFLNRNSSNDIDLLLVHEDTSINSCVFALKCKKRLKQTVKPLHITVLSQKEEQGFNFVATAKAKLLGTIRNGYFEKDISTLCHCFTKGLTVDAVSPL